MTARQRARSGSPYEPAIGFVRAVRAGSQVFVSGTAPVWPDGSCPDDPAVQARRCFEIAVEALSELGGTAADVVRTRMFLTSPDVADAVGEAHRSYFGEHPPAATMVVVSALLDPRWQVEIELDAVVDLSS